MELCQQKHSGCEERKHSCASPRPLLGLDCSSFAFRGASQDLCPTWEQQFALQDMATELLRCPR